jgi:serine/threonine protein kinase
MGRDDGATPLFEVGAIFSEGFVIQCRAGAGGMGVIFRAHDRETGAPVALKASHSAEPARVARFLQESRLLQQIEHPAVVRLVAAGTDRNAAYFAMEWIEGED